LNPDFQGLTVPESRILQNAGNGKIVGRLTLPEQIPAAKYPLIVHIYGGGVISGEPGAYAGGYLADNISERRVLGRGYALLEVSSWIEGYGTTCQQIAASVDAAVAAALATGRVDADRMGIYGYSFGGYSVNCVITQSHRFRAAVASAGLSDLASMYLGPTRAALEVSQARVGGRLWEMPERYLDQSPVFHLDKVTTPLLLVHAADDLTVPYSQAEEMYYGLKALGKEVMLVRYPKKGYRHAFAAHNPSYWPRILDWFDFYLRLQTGEVGVKDR
jgi:dipeptidyl aminopeptidase/acylaminoacyl peptidase